MIPSGLPWAPCTFIRGEVLKRVPPLTWVGDAGNLCTQQATSPRTVEALSTWLREAASKMLMVLGQCRNFFLRAEGGLVKAHNKKSQDETGPRLHAACRPVKQNISRPQFLSGRHKSVCKQFIDFTLLPGRQISRPNRNGSSTVALQLTPAWSVRPGGKTSETSVWD